MSDSERLRALLRRRIESAREEAVGSRGEVSPATLDSLERLARLVEIGEAAEPRPPARRSRWPVAALFVLTLAIASALLFARMPATDVELEVAADEASFAVAEEQFLTEVMPLTELGAAGIAALELPRTRNGTARSLAAAGGAGMALRLAAAPDGGNPGAITLAQVRLPAGARVSVAPTEVPGQFRLRLNGGPEIGGPRVELSLRGTVDLEGDQIAAERIDFGRSPKRAVLVPGGGEIELFVTPADPRRNAVAPQLGAAELALFRIEESVGTGRSIVRRVSTVRSGALYLESLDGRRIDLRPGEGLRFERSRGLIRTLELADGEVGLRFNGEVGGMTTGSGERRRSLMPTWLDWLRAHHGLGMLWGAALYLFGLVGGLLRWWKG